MPQQVTVGRIVHYTPLDRDEALSEGEPFVAALVSRIAPDGSVSLYVFHPVGPMLLNRIWETSSPAGSEEARGRWCWPARE